MYLTFLLHKPVHKALPTQPTSNVLFWSTTLSCTEEKYSEHNAQIFDHRWSENPMDLRVRSKMMQLLVVEQTVTKN